VVQQNPKHTIKGQPRKTAKGDEVSSPFISFKIHEKRLHAVSKYGLFIQAKGELKKVLYNEPLLEVR